MPAANQAPFEIVAGAADVYVAPTGTAFPAIDAAPGSPWRYLGHTDGGVTVNHTQTVVELRTDQVTAPVKAVRSEESLEITFSLAQVTPENYETVLGHNSSITTLGSDGHYEIPIYTGGFGVETVAMLVRGSHLSSKGDYNLQYEVPNVYQSGSPSVSYTKDAKALLACSFMAIAANAFIPGTPDKNIFGVLRIGAHA